jgi:hypothetical protein
MRSLTLLACAIVLGGCTKAEDRSVGAAATGDTAATAATTAETSPISLSELAGTWKVRTTDEQGGTPIETHLRATADSSGWTMVGPDNKPVPVRVVAVGGDSIVTEAGPFPSYVLKGAKVSTHTVFRLQGDKLVGTTEARYKIGTRDSVALRAAEGTRVR